MGGQQSKKCDYKSISSKTGRYINEDNEVSKRQSDFKRKYKPASASPAGAVAAARILTRYSGSPLKKRLKSDKIKREDKNITQDSFPDMKPMMKNIKNIPSTSLELETIERHGKEVHFANNKESTTKKSYHHLIDKICLRSGPYFRKVLLKPTVEAKRLLTYTKTEYTVVKTNSETDYNDSDNVKDHDDILAQIKLDKLKSQILSEIPKQQVIIMEKLMVELKQRLAQRKETEKSTTSQHQPKKDTKNYDLKIRHSYSRSRYTPYEKLKQNQKEYLETPLLATHQHGSFPQLHRVLKPRFLHEIPEEQVKLMEKVMAELKEHIAKRNLKREMQTLCQTSTCLNEKCRNEVKSQAQHQHDLAVTSSRSSVFEELTKELELRRARSKLLTGISRKRDTGMKSQAKDLAVLSSPCSISEKPTKEMDLRIAKRALENKIRAASTKPNIIKPDNTQKDRHLPYEIPKQIRKKYCQLPLPTESEGENIDLEIRRTLRPLFLSQIPREQATLIGNVMSELRERLAKRSAEYKDKNIYSISPKLTNWPPTAAHCLQPAKLRIQTRNVYGRSPICYA